MAEQSLKDKTIKGVGWSAIDNVVQFGVTFVVSIILARLLSPDDYGLIGIVTIFTTVCSKLVNSGMGTAIIRKKDATDDDYNTAFIVNMLMSLILYFLIFICAPFIADFFNRDELVALMRVSTLSLILGALSLVQQTRLTKRIDFKTQTKVTIIASGGSAVIGIVLAFCHFGVWALVAQLLSLEALKTFLLWLYNRWIPRIYFSVESFRSLFGFGWKIMVSSLIDSLWKDLYQVVVGKFYSPSTLGQYTRSKQFSSLFSGNLTGVVQRVTYPVLSSIQGEKERLVSAYRRIIKTTMFVSAVGTCFVGAIAQPLIYCLIGSKWHEAAQFLPLICINGSIYPLHAINLNMLQVQGRSDLFLRLEIVKKIVAVGPLLVGVFVGIMPMLYTSLISGAIAYFHNSFYSGRLLGYSSWMQIKDVAPFYCIGSVIAVAVYFLKYLPLSFWIILPLQMVIGLTVLCLVCTKMDIKEYIEIKDMVQGTLKKFH